MKKNIFGIIAVLVLVLVVAKLLFLEIVTIPSNSMLPTLFPGDFVLISKTKKAAVEDIIVFKREGELYIKRVIAKGNDIISYVNDKVIVNKREFIYRESQLTKVLPRDIKKRKFLSYIESSVHHSYPDHYYKIFIDKDKLTRKLVNVQVPDNSYFVLGDNRNHSFDSRDFGAVKFNDVVGTAILWW